MDASKSALFISLSLHALLILLLVNEIKPFNFYGILKPDISINAYLSPSTLKVLNHPQMQNQIKPITKTNPMPNSKMKAIHQKQSLSANSTQTLSTEIKQPAPEQIQKLLQLIAQNIQQHLAYPNIAATHIQQGQSLLQFQLAQNGTLQHIEVIKSSGTSLLDQAAIKAIIDSSPINIPNNIKITDPLTLRLPVNFNIQ